MSTALIREQYDYHRWANRRLFEVADALGAEGSGRDMGKHWSFPTLKATFAHIYAADSVWLSRWKGQSPARLFGDADFASMADLRTRWDALEGEQRTFVEALGEADLTREIEYKNTEGAQFRVALGALPLHVANHATHHRSEVATMLTLISGSPPDTGINTFRVSVLKR
jgi:uncharacterized damage-inducible protein DinB